MLIRLGTIVALLAATPAAAQINFQPVYPTPHYMQPPGSSSYTCTRAAFSGRVVCMITSAPLFGWHGFTVPDPATFGRKGLVVGPQGQALTCEFIPNGAGGLIRVCRPAQTVISRGSERILPINRAPALPTTPRGSMKVEVAMTRTAGDLYRIPAAINGSMPLRFLLDTGATDVSIPRSIATKLMREGSLTVGDYARASVGTLADGRRVPEMVFILRSITVGGVTATNVECSVGPEGSSLLLGQSFLRKFRSWSIDNARGVLVLG